MAYTKTNWVNGQTPINATNLNHIEDGIFNIYNDLFPVGSIVIKADNSDYSNWLGFTWERTLVGRVAVGIDSTQTEFDTIGETGGEKTHKHLTAMGFGQEGYLYGYLANNGDPVTGSEVFGNVKRASTNLTVQDNEPVRVAYTADGTSLQPYQVVAYWKRVS